MSPHALGTDAERNLKTELLLSEVPALTPEDAEAATEIERHLAAGDTERVIDYVWHEATESELRALWGDR